MRARGVRQHEYEHRADPLFRRVYGVSPTLNSFPFFLARALYWRCTLYHIHGIDKTQERGYDWSRIRVISMCSLRRTPSHFEGCTTSVSSMSFSQTEIELITATCMSPQLFLFH